MIRLILCVVGISCVFSAPQYRDLIPNGYQVFNPCGANFWEAVGHYNAVHHTIDKNPFGKVKPKKTDMFDTSYEIILKSAEKHYFMKNTMMRKKYRRKIGKEHAMRIKITL